MSAVSLDPPRPLRVFLAGATGALGRVLVPHLLAAGHEVVALTRSPEKARALEARGVTTCVASVWDRDALRAGVERARPDAVVHQLTALPERLDTRRVVRQLEETNRLRAEGTERLLEAALGSGARVFVAQSLAFAHRPGGARKTEEDPLYLDAPAAFRPLIEAVHALETATLAAPLRGVVLRYGLFYGPGTYYAADGTFAADVRARRVPIVGRGEGELSFLDLRDAAAATRLALEREVSGRFHVAEEPVSMAAFLPAYAARLGAPPPLRVPTWLARLLGGPYAVYLGRGMRGADSSRARRELGWEPRHEWRRDILPALTRAPG